MRSQKTEIYPTEDQKELLEKSFNLSRFAWNIALSEWNYQYTVYCKTRKKEDRPDARKIRNKFVACVKPHEPWIKIPPKDAHDNAILDLGKAWDRFFKDKTHRFGKPKFKSKRKAKKSFRMESTRPKFLQWKQNRLYVPKFRKLNCLKTAEFKRWNGELKQVTISRIGDRYFASCLFREQYVPLNQYKRHRHIQDKVGIDVGIEKFATMSDGRYFRSVETKKIDRKIKHQQRLVARKKRGSRNREKQITKLQNAYRQKANMINDNIHKVTNYLVRHFKQINIENLRSSNMMKNHNLARRIADGQFYKFKIYLQYKAEYIKEKGRKVDICLVNPRNTSQICSNCGHKQSKKLDLSVRELHCEKCGFVCDRDLNAAINISKLA